MIHEINKAREIYRLESDESLISFAKSNVDSLSPEIISVLIDELKKRGIGPELIQHIESKYEILDELKINNWIEIIRNSKCPECNQKGNRLICFKGRNTFSILIKSTYLKRTFIACEHCKAKIIRRLNYETFLLGWWSFYGLFRTPYSIILNLVNKNLNPKSEKENMTRYVLYNYKQLKEFQSNLDEYLKNNS
ncbi:MAG: hypothetical protein DWQ02_05710 [Bacteroidetes bacterium]|nr:MAG: hypothetical protein DWQ02_05710 [Bacteroidota bacterium]